MARTEKQKRYIKRRYAEIAAMPKIRCACGCRAMIAPLTKQFKPARYKPGHNSRTEVDSNAVARFKRGQTPWNKDKKTPQTGSGMRGTTLSRGQIEQRTRTRREKNQGHYSGLLARGWTRSEEANRKQAATAKERGVFAGPNNPAWRGGVSFEPYPSVFNKRLKLSVLRRQDHKCADCKHLIDGYRPNKIPDAKKSNIHHLDGNKQNCELENLIGLCVSCHMMREWQVTKRMVQSGR